LQQFSTAIQAAELGSPAILIIGSVVELADICAWFPGEAFLPSQRLQHP
ncbi:uroporphyrinogen-III C-methyltransferase, partial [Acidithiobacillus sp. RW2]|nr:uroporphyrinogen-III C-methyltransferase [Acidithiobacillus sulfurivorans]MBU2760353.1 uroporphyrinogen-III C-methyltransferase [Acidithiobacillus sulfurivorans]